jgi:hypothetical protein
MVEPADVLRRLRWRLRLQGAGLLFAGHLLVVAGILIDRRSDATAVAMAIGVGLAVTGLWRLLRLPVYLRRPEDIARIDLVAPGDRHAMQVVLESGNVCKLAPRPGEREQLKDALEKQIGVNRLRARVVRR